MHVIKRDGTRVLFNPNKIVNAINKAMISAYGSVYESDTAEEIADLIGSRGVDMSVEQIQDLVEGYLMKSEYPEVAKAYILYRDQRSKERMRQSKLLKAVMRRTEATAVENANANVTDRGKPSGTATIITTTAPIKNCTSVSNVSQVNSKTCSPKAKFQ